MARVNGFDFLGKIGVLVGVLGEAGSRLYLYYNPNSATKAAVADTLGIQGDQVLLFKALVMFQDYGVYAAAIGLLLIGLGKLTR